jgi:hypothetical protein
MSEGERGFYSFGGNRNRTGETFPCRGDTLLDTGKKRADSSMYIVQYRRDSSRYSEEMGNTVRQFHVQEIQFQIKRRKGHAVPCSRDTVPDTAKKGTDCSL